MKILEIKEMLLNGLIDYEKAFEMVKKIPKPWHLKEWSTKRSSIIKNKCEQCGIDNDVMVIQHLNHPEDFSTIRNRLFENLFTKELDSSTLIKQIVTDEDIKKFHENTTICREACPHCKWIRIRTRKTMTPKYFCEVCRLDFEIPKEIKYNKIFKTVFPSDDQVRCYLEGKQEKELLLNLKRQIYEKNKSALGKNALLLSIEQHLEYVELKNVTTFCKRCAAKMDLENKLLCYSCKLEYFDYLQYDCCFKCYKSKTIVKSPIKQKILEVYVGNSM